MFIVLTCAVTFLNEVLMDSNWDTFLSTAHNFYPSCPIVQITLTPRRLTRNSVPVAACPRGILVSAAQGEGWGPVIWLSIRYIWVWISLIHKVCTCLRLLTTHVYIETFEFLWFIVWVRRILTFFTIFLFLSVARNLDTSQTLYTILVYFMSIFSKKK